MSVHRKSEAVLRRLARVEGHIRGIAKMVQENRDCPTILLQIAAVQSALDKITEIILEDHIETCVAKAIREGRGEKAVQELKEAIARLL
ncbi:metal-sensitive transcriptional regulator [Candidatus Bathyarchaeota archaeon]|nr:metal-sensitive transcriptional regulator [Candidatus Bathyarchaeota archaeon]